MIAAGLKIYYQAHIAQQLRVVSDKGQSPQTAAFFTVC
jgi:hypothetical protein